jgi:hypothetical protein
LPSLPHPEKKQIPQKKKKMLWGAFFTSKRTLQPLLQGSF